MQALGKLVSVKGNEVTLSLDEQVNINQLSRWTAGKPIGVQVEFDDGRKRTLDQLRKAWALIRDVANWSGFEPEEAEQEMKVEYVIRTGHDWFSQSECSVDTEREFITTIIDFCFENDVPFKTKTWDMIGNDYHSVYEATIHRRCVVCGKPHADIDHVSHTVGMGRNRHKVDQTQFLFWSLCREHHQKRHAMGIKSFCQLYQLKPVKLDAKDIKHLKI